VQEQQEARQVYCSVKFPVDSERNANNKLELDESEQW